MAVFLFRCAKCFESFQIESRVGEPPQAPLCHCGNPMSRKWSAPGIVLKGTGWGRDGK
jgi:predicted nucleic acid-binding Zn ribbon protein